jgi:hypothetical protein
MAFLALLVLMLPQAGEHEKAFVELAAQTSASFVEQPVRLTIRFGVEREFLHHNLLQLFTRPLDVPVQLEFAFPAQTAEAPTLGPTFALGEEILRPARSREEERAGATFVVLELERTLVPGEAGRIEIPAPVLHFAFATRFGEDSVGTSLPLDRQSGEVRGAALALEIAPLPEQGRPAGFGNAVGRFTLAARAEPRELAVGERIVLALTITGQGNLARLEPPRLDGFEGLHLLGSTQELQGDTRTLRCELVAESPKAREIPSIALDYFDPEARAYGRASTQPIPLRVQAPPSQPGQGASVSVPVLVLLGLGVLIAAVLVRRARA